MNVVNIHPGIITQYRGSCSVEWAILNDDEVGNTSHFMTEVYDQGQIIFIEKYNLSFAKDYIDVRVHVFKKGIELKIKTVLYLMKKDIINLKPKLELSKGGCIYKGIPNQKLETVKNKIKFINN